MKKKFEVIEKEIRENLKKVDLGKEGENNSDKEKTSNRKWWEKWSRN